MMVNDHRVVHVVHLFSPIEPRLTNKIVVGFLNIDESFINELDTTVELGHMLGKNCLLILVKPSNIIINCFINVGGNENCIITYCILALIPLSCFMYRMN